MRVSVLIDPKQKIKCHCCGDRRYHPRIKGYRMPAKYLGKMSFDLGTGKWQCNRCDYSFSKDDLKLLKPKPETMKIFRLMGQLADPR